MRRRSAERLTCPRCREQKPVYSFNRATKDKYGVQGYCRPCNGKYHEQWRGKHLKACGYCMEIKLQAEFRERMCSACYEQWGVKKPCTVDGCGGVFDRRGGVELCPPHRYRQRRYGNALAGRALRGSQGIGWKDRQGYIRLKDGKRTRFEHQVVMERKLGRPMWPWENVHHKNGIRHDNRLDNLELWVRPQPSGQRVSDHVAHAIKILSAYAPHLLVFIPDEQTA